jgi:two-component system OmpR family sensor kinase
MAIYQLVSRLQPSTEVGRLAKSLNIMLGRIENQLRPKVLESKLRRFVADASHELRTHLPLFARFCWALHRQGAVTGATS